MWRPVVTDALLLLPALAAAGTVEVPAKASTVVAGPSGFIVSSLKVGLTKDNLIGALRFTASDPASPESTAVTTQCGTVRGEGSRLASLASICLSLGAPVIATVIENNPGGAPATRGFQLSFCRDFKVQQIEFGRMTVGGL